MNEELQSTNEELETVNDELRRRERRAEAGQHLPGVDPGQPPRRRRGRRRRAARPDLEPEGGGPLGPAADEVRGRNLLNLDIGLPVERLQPAIRACVSGEVPLPGDRPRGDQPPRQGHPLPGDLHADDLRRRPDHRRHPDDGRRGRDDRRRRRRPTPGRPSSPTAGRHDARAPAITPVRPGPTGTARAARDRAQPD